MSTFPLPERPHLDPLRRQARDLQCGVRAGDREVIERVTSRYGNVDQETCPLATAQLVVAREYGCRSWARLKDYVELVTTYRWEVRPGEAVTADERNADPGDAFCRLACLTYAEGDGPHRWAAATKLLSERPELLEANIWAAAAASELAVVQELLADKPHLARSHGGPYGWSPLCYLAFARVAGQDSAAAIEIARLLLESGADPNEGYLWNGAANPFTLLAGALGEGELGPDRQPPHPQQDKLAPLLLRAGADPNDSQALYNRMFTAGVDHLELLFAHGLGSGAGGPWRARLGDRIDTPTELLRFQLWWAVSHGMVERVRLLARYDVDLQNPFADGRTPLEVARIGGYADVVEVLAAAGAEEPALAPEDALVAAAFAADRAEAERVRRAHPDAVESARRDRPGLIVWAAASGRVEAVRLLVELGWDVNAFGRGDANIEGAHATALHYAAADGEGELVRLLLELGADVNLRDVREYGATPLEWARHFEQPTTIELLRSYSSA